MKVSVDLIFTIWYGQYQYNERMWWKTISRVLQTSMWRKDVPYQTLGHLSPERPVHFWKLYWNKNRVKFLFSYFFLVPLCGAFKAFIKPFEVPQRSVKIKIQLNFFTLSGIETLRVKGATRKQNCKNSC